MTVKVAGQNATDRLMGQVKDQTRRLDLQAAPTAYQVAMVLHALADHTAIMEALKHRPDPTSPWPEANSIGRWFHDVGDELEGYQGSPERDHSPYIEISPDGFSKSGKTKVWRVHNRDTGEEIGYIRWAGNWRKYVFEDYQASYYDWKCLRQIADFCEKATADHRMGAL